MKYLYLLIIALLINSCEQSKYYDTGPYIKPINVAPSDTSNNLDIKSLSQGIGTYIKCYFSVNKNKLTLWGKVLNSKNNNLEYAYDKSGKWFNELNYMNNIYYTLSSNEYIKNTCKNAYVEKFNVLENFNKDFIIALASLTEVSKDNEFWTNLDKETGKYKFNRIITFGDSLSDTHNIFNKFYFRFVPRPDAYLFGIFSNGLPWIQYVAKTLVEGNHINFAEGGSEIQPNGGQGFVTKSIKEQVEHFHSIVKHIPKNINNNFNNTLFVFFAGGNDFLYKTYKDPVTLANQLMDSVEKTIQLGAKYILLPKYFNVVVTPLIREKAKKDPFLIEQITNDINKFNETQENRILELMKKYQVIILHPDFYDFLNQNIQKDTFKNKSEPCNKSSFMYDFKKANLCSNHIDYLFWDEVHPTAKAHCMLANEVFTYMNSFLKVNIPLIGNCEDDLIGNN